MRIGFDNERYIQMQAGRIRKRIRKFGGKPYPELGGKLYDDHHASRVLLGFKPDSKARMLANPSDSSETVTVINAEDIDHSKRRSGIVITYDEGALRLLDIFRCMSVEADSIVITRFTAQPHAMTWQKHVEGMGVKVYRHYLIEGYPALTDLIVSGEGFGKNDFIVTEEQLRDKPACCQDHQGGATAQRLRRVSLGNHF